MSSKKYEGLTMSAIDTSYVVGLMLGPSLGGFLFDQVGTYLPFLVFGCFSFLLLIFSLLLRRKIHESSTESENDHVDNTSSSSSCQSFLRMLTLPAMLGKTSNKTRRKWQDSNLKLDGEKDKVQEK